MLCYKDTTYSPCWKEKIKVCGFTEEKKLPKIGKEYSSTSLNDNITNHGWKVDSLRSNSSNDIYYLKKDKWILYCLVSLDAYWIETTCSLV